jgi:hypothetical protein
MAKLDANQEKAAADKEDLKAAMQSMRTELDDKIQHGVENILAIVEHDKQTLRSETCAAIDETKRELKARLGIVQMKAERVNTATIVASTAQPPTFYGNST